MTTDPDDAPDHPGGYSLDDLFAKPVDGDGIDGDVLKPKPDAKGDQ